MEVRVARANVETLTWTAIDERSRKSFQAGGCVGDDFFSSGLVSMSNCQMRKCGAKNAKEQSETPGTPSMGAALASHELTDPRHLQLLGEYIDHSRKVADECARIFRGSLGVYDDEMNSTPPSNLGARKPAYSRHIQIQPFEEVFGMLVADPEPHFRFFHHGKIPPADAPKTKAEATVCAHRVFCAVAILMKADLHTKIDFVLRLYADIAGVFTPEAKSSLLKDFITTVEGVFQLTDQLPSSVLTTVERAFWSDEADKLMTVLELYDVCLTNPHIGAMLHSIHALVEDFSASQHREKLLQRENKARVQLLSLRHGGENSSVRTKSMARSMSSIILPRGSLLWDLKAGDYGRFWQHPELLQLQASDTCAHALELMTGADATSAMVVERTRIERECLGLVSTDKLLQYFTQFLVPGFQSTTMTKVYEHTHARAEEAIRQFGATPLRDLVQFFVTERAPQLCTVRDDEAFFSVITRFVCGESTVAVVQDYSSSPEAVLGRVSVFDILTWLYEDLTLMKGKERCAVAAFPQFFFAPATVDSMPTCASTCEALVEIALRRLSGIFVTAAPGSQEMKTLSANTFRDLFTATYSCLNSKDGEPGPLLRSVAANAALLTPACVVFPDTSIAKVVCEMTDKRTRRVIIQRRDGLTVGAICASDILLLLLQAQHRSLAAN